MSTVCPLFHSTRRPLHPERFWNFLNTEFEGLYRAGLLLAGTQPEFMAEMMIAGTAREFKPTGYWLASVPESQWPKDERVRAYIRSKWDPQFGDRYQRMVFIGKTSILPLIQEHLERCIFTDAELDSNVEYLSQIKDPFGHWGEAMSAENA